MIITPPLPTFSITLKFFLATEILTFPSNSSLIPYGLDIFKISILIKLREFFTIISSPILQLSNLVKLFLATVIILLIGEVSFSFFILIVSFLINSSLTKASFLFILPSAFLIFFLNQSGLVLVLLALLSK